jgi:hypothetical protein
VVLVGPDHRLARPGPVGVGELEGEESVVSGHRDGAAYDGRWRRRSRASA